MAADPGAFAPPHNPAPADVGLTHCEQRGKMWPMDSPTAPRHLLPLALRAAQQLEDWERLRDELQALHAQLEYLRLMLKLQSGK